MLFSLTPAQIVAEESFRISNSEAIREEVDAGFAQVETRLFQNRLSLLTGVRYEKTIGKGRGELFEPTVVWQRLPNGEFAHSAAGARIRRPEAGAVGSLEELRLTRIERGLRAKRASDGYYPSLHLSFNATPNLLARFGYAKVEWVVHVLLVHPLDE